MRILMNFYSTVSVLILCVCFCVAIGLHIYAIKTLPADKLPSYCLPLEKLINKIPEVKLDFKIDSVEKD